MCNGRVKVVKALKARRIRVFTFLNSMIGGTIVLSYA